MPDIENGNFNSHFPMKIQ